MKAACFLLLASVAGAAPPNFVVVFCDDLGYADVGCYGSQINPTPRIDRMAREGTRFTSFYAGSPVCTPSRAGLLLGCYARRVDLDLDSKGLPVFFPGEPKGIAPTETTLAEALKSVGYKTACIGKWHLGDQPPHLPTRHGFDHWFGLPYSNDMEWAKRGDPPLPLMRGEKIVEQADEHRALDQSLLTKRYTEEATRWLESVKEEPFFLYLAHTMPHNPVAARPRFFDQTSNPIPKFGASVAEIDWSTGELLDWLEANGLAENTLVLFTSDNGGAPRWGASNTPLRGKKATCYEGGIRVPCVAWWPGVVPAGAECAAQASVLDVLPTFANLAGAPLDAATRRDGADIGSLLRDPTAETADRTFYYWYSGQLQAVRHGRWKLLLPGKFRLRSQGAPELYDLVEDLSESNDLAESQPTIVAMLSAMADAHRAELGELDQPGPAVRPAARVDEAGVITRTSFDDA